MYISQKSREVYNRMAYGWNTWDVQSVTAYVLLPVRLRVNISFIVPHMSGYSGNSLWNNVEAFGEHSIDGSYTEVLIRYLNGLYKIETSAEGSELLVKITTIKPRYNCYVALEASVIWSGMLDIGYDNNRIVALGNNEKYIIDCLNEKVEPDWNPIVMHNLICKAEDVVYFTVNSSKSAEEIETKIRASRNKWLGSVISAEGKLGEGLAALRRSLLWNRIYEPRKRRVITPVSRNWCRGRGEGFGDYVLFGWDTFFAALQYGLIDKNLAYSTMFSILEEETSESMIPNFGSATGKSRDRSEPQVGSLCAWKLYLQFGDRWFIEECFGRLLSWNRWRFRERDLNGDGLLELASVPWEADREDNHIECGSKQCAMFESGLDNSPMWDRAVFNEEKHCLELSYVGENALMVVDCEILEKMAGLLGRERERAELEEKRKNLSARINSELWSEEACCYLNRHWSGEFDPCLSLTHFYVILADIAGKDRVESMVKRHLLNPGEFWGEYVIPNVSRNDASFREQDYWRGRIWGPTNFLVGEGILRIKEKSVFDELAGKGLDMFVKCWREKGVVGENYNAVTGDAAENAQSSDRFYHWGALLVYMAVQSIVFFNEWDDKVDYSNIPGWLSGIRNLPMRDGKIDIIPSDNI